jgi:hypothetical protein
MSRAGRHAEIGQEEPPYEIRERTFAFAVRVIRPEFCHLPFAI